MSIQNILNTQSGVESRRPAAGRAKTTGASFQDQLTRTSAQAKAPAADAGRTAFTKEDLLSALGDFKTTSLKRMKEAKEQQEEQEAWDKLKKYLDAWIESLRDEADVRKIARAHAALTALQSEAASGREDLGSCLLNQLEGLLA